MIFSERIDRVGDLLGKELEKPTGCFDMLSRDSSQGSISVISI
jgi:hypothetical protein